MLKPVRTNLLFAPQNLLVEAEIHSLSPRLIEEKISQGWWHEDCLKARLKPEPIDLHWNWNECEIERDGVILGSEKIGISTDDGNVQGAMLISNEPVETLGHPALFVELLFTAPRNRRDLRKDGQDYFVGVGKILLAWGAERSRNLGYKGALRLDGSPEFVAWYINRGLQKLDENPILYEGVSYTPMYLSAESATKLIASAPGIGST